MADESDKQTQEEKPPELLKQGGGPSRGVTVTLACLAGLLIVGAAIANSLPNLDGFSLPSLDRFTLPKFDHIALPSFIRNPAPKSTQLAATAPPEAPKPPRETVTVPIPDPAVTAALTDIQSSQRQHTIVLASLTQDSATQRDDLKKISRQLSALAGQVEALSPPLTTSSITRQPFTTSSIPRQHARARIIRTPRKTEPALPPPVGPVSIGGAPLSPAPAPAPTPAPVAVSSAK